MVSFLVDLIYVLAGIASVISFKHGGVEQLAKVACAYGLVAVLFQFFAHIFERIFNTKIDEKKFLKEIFVIMLSFICAFTITQFFIPVPHSIQ